MNLIPPTSPEYFHQTSEDPYDRHTYRLHLSNGEHRDFNSWEETAGAWFQLPALFTSHVEVLDKPDKKPKRQTKGFK